MNNNITAGTIARTIVLLLALANQVLAMCGKQVLNIADDDIYQIVSIVLQLVRLFGAGGRIIHFQLML